MLPEVVRRVPGVRVALVGPENPSRPEYVAELRAALAREGLTDAVSFLGFREDALELISGFDVVVVPSVPDERGFGREGFGYVGLEGFAVGTPVVAYDDGALRETLGDCAVLVPAGRPCARSRMRSSGCSRTRRSARGSSAVVASGSRAGSPSTRWSRR